MHFTLMQSLRFFIKAAERLHLLLHLVGHYFKFKCYIEVEISKIPSPTLRMAQNCCLRTCYNETIAPYRRTDPKR